MRTNIRMSKYVRANADMSKVPLTIVASYSAALEGTISILQMILHLSIYREQTNKNRMSAHHCLRMVGMTGTGRSSIFYFHIDRKEKKYRE